jgi:hypothetical protein
VKNPEKKWRQNAMRSKTISSFLMYLFITVVWVPTYDIKLSARQPFPKQIYTFRRKLSNLDYREKYLGGRLVGKQTALT